MRSGYWKSFAATCGLFGFALAGCKNVPPSQAPMQHPQIQAATPAVAEGPYAAWERHTEGNVGSDLFPSALPAQAVKAPRITSLVFASNRHGHEYKLYLREPGTRAYRQLTFGNGHDIHPDCHPTRDEIVFASNRSGDWRLYRLRHLNDRQPMMINTGSAPVIHPSFSPDGSRVVYSRRSPTTGEWEIWMHELGGGTQHVTNGLFAEFHPDGQRLVFQRHRRRDQQWYSIWTIRMDGTHETEIAVGKSYGVVNPHWSPDGTWVIYNSVGRDENPESLATTSGGDLYMVRADGSQETRLTFKGTPEWNPHWGQDGRVYFNALSEEGEVSLWSLQPPG